MTENKKVFIIYNHVVPKKYSVTKTYYSYVNP